MTNDDTVGVMVRKWAMELCNGDPRDAMVLSQITWWLQPSQENGSPRCSEIVEMDGSTWLCMTDEKLAERPGLSSDQVYRARMSLKKRGLIECRVRKVNGLRTTVTRSLLNRDPAVSEIATSRNGQIATSRNGSNRDLAVSIPYRDVEPREVPEVVATASTAPEVEALCVFLADSIEAHRVKHDRPVITKKWRDDMGLLVKNGPLHVHGARPVPPEKVVASIRCLFADLADRDRNGFCWADQIQSPGSLRAKWVQLREARRRTEDRGVSASQAVVNRRRRRREASEADGGPEQSLADLMFPPTPLALMQGEGS